MKSTIQWLDAVKKKHGLTSDYKLAQRWEVSRALISKYRNGDEFLSEETAAKVAADTGQPLHYVLSCAAVERAKRPDARKAWETVARAAAAGATALFLLVFVGGWLPVDGLELAFLMPAGITHYAQIALGMALWLALAAAGCALTTRTLPGHQNRFPIAYSPK